MDFSEVPDDLDGDSGAGIEGVQHLAKSLVRYALSCEHSRRPIKRQDINEKGLYLHCLIAVVIVSTTHADSNSALLTNSAVQTSLCAGQQPAHGRFWNATSRTAQGRTSDSAAKARYASYPCLCQPLSLSDPSLQQQQPHL